LTFRAILIKEKINGLKNELTNSTKENLGEKVKNKKYHTVGTIPK